MAYHFDNEKHLHFWDDKPLTGTSSVVDVLAKPLTWWASGLACKEFGWVKAGDWKKLKTDIEKGDDKARRIKACEPVLNEIKKMSAEEYLKKLDKAYRAHNEYKNEKADEGTDLHAELEKFAKSEMGKKKYKDSEFNEKIKPFIEWARANVKKYVWSEAHCFSTRLWTGGISDLGVELNDGTFAVIDFKSSKEAYIGQFIQCAGYATEIEENGLCDITGKHCKKIDSKIGALIIVPFGASPVLPVIMRDVEAYKKAFEAAVVLYRLIFNHNE